MASCLSMNEVPGVAGALSRGWWCVSASATISRPACVGGVFLAAGGGRAASAGAVVLGILRVGVSSGEYGFPFRIRLSRGVMLQGRLEAFTVQD